MNRQVFTLMTVFLMLGALWNGAWGANTDETSNDITVQKVNKSKDATLVDEQYYLIGTASDGSFLTGKTIIINNTTYTTLGTAILSSALTKDNIDDALWKITNVTAENKIIGCYLTNKKTGKKLTLSSTGEALSTDNDDDPDSFLTQFSWFKDNKYQETAASIFILNSGDKYLTTSGISTTTEELNVFTTKEIPMTSQQLNDRMGGGFILAAKGFSKVEETPLLNHKLVALTFTLESNHGITGDKFADLLNQAKEITGYESDKSSRTYFIYSGYENFEKKWSEKEEENIKITNSTITITKSNVESVIKAFKAATFVAAGNSIVLNLTTIFTDRGYGCTFTTKTGNDLLKSGASVSYLNAQFEVFYSQNQGSAMTINDLNIQLNYAKFKGTTQKVSPYVITIADENYLITVPAGSGKSTRFGFASSGGTVDYNHFKGKAYSITIADKEVELGKKEEDNTTTWKAIDYTRINLIGGTIHPLSEGKFIPIKNDDDEIIDYKYNDNNIFCEANEFLANKPEGQWMVTKNSTPSCLLLNNRESAKQIKIGNKEYGYILYKVDDAKDLYYIPGGLTGYYNDQMIKIDTLRFTQQSQSGFDGYAHSKKTGDEFDAVILKNTAYKLGIQNGTFDNSIVYIQRSSTHNNTLVVNVKENDEGLSFYLVPCDTVPYGITTPKDGYIDNLKRIKYALQERTSKRYVIYDNINRRFILSDDYDDVDKALEDAEKFFFKEKEEGQYILLRCEEEYKEIDNVKQWRDKTTKKVYANIGDAFLHEINMYKKDIADKFGFYSSLSPMFADIMKEHKGDNDTTLVKINLYSVQNRSGNQKYMLAAGENNFLTEGIPDTRSDIIINSKAIGGLSYDSIKFSITIDTAYVRRTYMTDEKGKKYLSSVMPLYYLGMSSFDPKENVAVDTIGPIHPWDKDEFGHLIECQHYLRYTSGNFLFAMTDSIAHGMDKFVQREDHCYHYWNTHNPRLRFVHASHMRDTMIVSSIRPASKDTMRAGYITTTIEASKEKEWLAPQVDETGRLGSPNYGLFAFEVNPNPSDPDVPEYALWNPASKKYVAYLNGNLIIADQPSYYTLDVKREGHSIVSNEMARTSDVRVIASQGKVIIQHAAGKKAFLQTALGKTIADVVLTSDQEEITAPAGIVFVTVEGEETEKTIVK